ncbi:MAG TPA: glycosyltransferase [Phnomibacter sp.]|nr:glycosyltransferase [Phnomibacter sp.]
MNTMKLPIINIKNREKSIILAAFCNASFGISLVSSLGSLLKNSDRSYHYEIVVFSYSVPNKTIAWLEKALSETGRTFTLTLVECSKLNILPQLINCENWSVSYLKLLLAEMFPVSDKIIYLDTDIVFYSDIAIFHEQISTSLPITAIQDSYLKYPSKDEIPLSHASVIDETGGYFNAGLIGFNFPKWRSEKLSEKLLSYIDENSSFLPYQEQTAMNIVLHKRWKRLDDRFNMPAAHFDIDQAKSLGINCHFLGPCKPWLYDKRKNPQALHFYNCLKELGFEKYKPSLLKYLVQIVKADPRLIGIYVLRKIKTIANLRLH